VHGVAFPAEGGVMPALKGLVSYSNFAQIELNFWRISATGVGNEKLCGAGCQHNERSDYVDRQRQYYKYFNCFFRVHCD